MSSFLKIARHVAVFCAVASLPGAAWLPAASAGESEIGYGGDWTLGYETNPLLVSDDGPNGGYTQLRLSGNLTHYLGSGESAAFFLTGNAASRIDESETSSAGHDSANLRSGFALSPGFASRRLVISVGGRFSAYRGTFIDRTDGEIYTAGVVPATDPESSISIGERLDYDLAGTFLNLRVKQSPRLSWFLNSSFDRVDYVADYTAQTDLDPLDFSSLALTPGVRIGFGQVTTLQFSVARTELDYDARPALDRDGFQVAGTTREYEFTEFQASLSVQPAARTRFSLGASAGGRDDTYAGYYDSSDGAGSLSFEHSFGERSRLSAYTSIREVEYDHATVSGDPTDLVRSSDERRHAARYTHRFGDRFEWYVEGGADRTDSPDPIFAYEREWILTGMHFER